jgi:hypothetical protein
VISYGGLSVYRLLLKISIARGTVLISPISKSVQPTAFLVSLLSLPETNKAAPAPNIPLVPAISASSGKVISVDFKRLLFFIVHRGRQQ